MVKQEAATAVHVVELSGDRNGGYKLNEKELENILLHKDYINKKVAVISVAGAFRKGKSFLLNFLVLFLDWLKSGYDGSWFNAETVLDKFKWKGGTKRDTHGILLWSKPYLLKDQNGEEIVVLLMDTQGTFDHSSTVKECATIFAMSTLLSSVQVFNVSQQIQEDDLQNLRLFTEYATLAQKKAKTTPFQKLLFLVRDWQNSEEHDYGFEGGDQYLDDVFKVTNGQKRELQTLRKKLDKSFEEMKAFLMPHPGLRIAKNNSDQVLGEIEEDFEDQIEIFVPALFVETELEAKKIGGNEITCGELFQFFKAYMEIFNGDALPEPKSIFEATATAAAILAEEAARENYDVKINEFIGLNPQLSDVAELQNTHEAAMKNALDLFDNKPKLGSDEISKTHRNRLLLGIQTRYIDLKQQVAERQMAEESRKRLEEDRKKLEEERKANEAKTAAEREKIKKEWEEQEKKKGEIEEEQRRREAENKRREEEDKKREEQKMEKEKLAQDLRKRLEILSAKEKELDERERSKFQDNMGSAIRCLGQAVAGFVQGANNGGGLFQSNPPRPRSISPPQRRFLKSMSSDFEYGNWFDRTSRRGPPPNFYGENGFGEERRANLRRPISPPSEFPPLSSSGFPVRPPPPSFEAPYRPGGPGLFVRPPPPPPAYNPSPSSSIFPARPTPNPGRRMPNPPYHANMGAKPPNGKS